MALDAGASAAPTATPSATPTAATRPQIGPRAIVTIGSRKSELAMIQSRHVQSLLRAAHPACAFTIATSSTLGDDVQDVPLSTVGAANPGLFTKSLEVGIVSGGYDFAVHSLKDMPTTLPDGLVLAAITAREDPTDAVVLHPAHAATFAETKNNGDGNESGEQQQIDALSCLPAGAVVGTSSLRRQALISRKFPHLVVKSIRGNLNTRMAKLDASTPTSVARGGAGGYSDKDDDAAADATVHYDAIMLATAGLKRMGWGHRISSVVNPEDFPYGVSQGALGIECRVDDTWMREIVARIGERTSTIRCSAERAFLRALQGGCQVPIGAYSLFDGTTLSLKGIVLSVDGKAHVEESATMAIVAGTLEEEVLQAERLGEQVAAMAKAKGADALLGREAGEPVRPITYSKVATN